MSVVAISLEESATANRSQVFPTPDGTSDLDPAIQKADHRQGGGGVRRARESGLTPLLSIFLPLSLTGSKSCKAILQKPRQSSLPKVPGGAPESCTTENFPELALAKLCSEHRHQTLYASIGTGQGYAKEQLDHMPLSSHSRQIPETCTAPAKISSTGFACCLRVCAPFRPI
jgi:hypothetical protein